MWWSTDTKLPTSIPVRFNFMPSWWKDGYGIVFGERLFTDIEYRARTRQEMFRLAHERFGEIGLGEADLDVGTPDENIKEIVNTLLP